MNYRQRWIRIGGPLYAPEEFALYVKAYRNLNGHDIDNFMLNYELSVFLAIFMIVVSETNESYGSE